MPIGSSVNVNGTTLYFGPETSQGQRANMIRQAGGNPRQHGGGTDNSLRNVNGNTAPRYQGGGQSTSYGAGLQGGTGQNPLMDLWGQLTGGGTSSMPSAGGSLQQRLAELFGPRESRVVSTSSGGGQGGLSSAALQDIFGQFTGASQASTAAANKDLRRAEGLLKGYGKADRRDIKRAGKRQQAGAAQSLLSRGLGNTTITDSVRRGIDEDTQRLLSRSREQTAVARSGLLERRAGMTLQALSPFQSQYLQLIQQLGAAGGIGRGVF